MSTEGENAIVPVDYTMIRQPYRITMSKWNYTVIQKRILTQIISKLQKEITLLEHGMPIGQLDLFRSNTDTVTLSFQLNDLVLNNNNYTHVKSALQKLRGINVEIILPATKSRKSKQPEQQTILTGLIERAEMLSHSRTITVHMHRATAVELVKVTNGLTVFAQDVMYLTNNTWTQKIYEVLSHWKDQEVWSITVEKFKDLLQIENKYPLVNDLIRYVVRPAEKELKEIGDIFFEFSVTKEGNRIAKFNFIIKHRKTLIIDEQKTNRDREYIITLLRGHFGFTKDHFDSLKEVLGRSEVLELVKEKLVVLQQHIKDARGIPGKEVKNIPNYVLKCLNDEFKS